MDGNTSVAIVRCRDGERDVAAGTSARIRIEHEIARARDRWRLGVPDDDEKCAGIGVAGGIGGARGHEIRAFGKCRARWWRRDYRDAWTVVDGVNAEGDVRCGAAPRIG